FSLISLWSMFSLRLPPVPGAQASLSVGASRFKLKRFPPLHASRDACAPESLFASEQEAMFLPRFTQTCQCDRVRPEPGWLNARLMREATARPRETVP